MSTEKDREAAKQELAQYYDRSAHEYYETHYQRSCHYSPLRYRQRYIEEMIENLDIPKGARVLDVGCGPGELTLSLLKKGYSVWAVDISQAMVDEAMRNINANGFPEWKQVYVGDIEQLEFSDDSFDVVVAAGVIEYQQDDEKALSEMQRILKKDSHVILNVTNRYSPMLILSQPYSWLKKQAAARAILDLLKQRILGRGRITPLPSRRIHSPRKFDKKLSELGLEKTGHNYFHFSPLPSPLCPLFGSICSPMGRWMEKLTGGPFGFLGGGYIVIARNCR